MKNLNYVVLDFETANGSRTSPCSIGMVKYINGEKHSEYYQLINPEEYFYQSNIRIHGIYPEDVWDQPTWGQVYPSVMQFIGDLPVAAHFATFDINVFRATTEKYDITLPTNLYFCSCILSKKILPLPSHKLNIVADYFGLTFEHHHALEDSIVAANIVRELANIQRTDTISDLVDSIGYQFGQINGTNFITKKTNKKRA
ncbi:3'-5' exonuclease [Listeria weihenstephanensis]|uniref:3'-5' exonuclease n=1 Tax=Listeria weihenstephanensis TaxID=1006155 RepID=A0A841ZBC3_9LIST|nr:3'-5' exonuclease [Listeria weihenstephanensis]MBC1501787.1 3'-5' exonuclease [Listeria weihenstephanensis]